MKDLGLTAKLMGSMGRKEREQVFNGVYYNLDAQVEFEYIYENQNELYEFFNEIGEGAFSNVRRALFLPTGEEMAVKILKEEKETSYII
jgi:serine/threonine protein kinase